MLTLKLDLSEGKRAYFASDFHLGAPNYEVSAERERRLVAWLNRIESECEHLFLLGDLFDFWFDYQYVVPKGFVRFLGKLAELSDKGIKIYIFTGNHDMWMFGYLNQEIGAQIFRSPVEVKWAQHNFMVGHGDGLGPGDHLYKFLKRVFSNRLCQRLFAFLHPRIGIGIAKMWSGHSRITNHKDETFLGEAEFLWQFCKAQEAEKHHDAYIFGHRHLPLDLPVGNSSRYLNLGEWMNHNRYLVWDGSELQMQTFTT